MYFRQFNIELLRQDLSVFSNTEVVTMAHEMSYKPNSNGTFKIGSMFLNVGSKTVYATRNAIEPGQGRVPTQSQVETKYSIRWIYPTYYTA